MGTFIWALAEETMDIEVQERKFLEQVLLDGLCSIEVVEKAARSGYAEDPSQPLFVTLVGKGFLDAQAAWHILRRLIGLERRPDHQSDTQVHADQLTRAFDSLDRAVQQAPAEEEGYWNRARARFQDKRYQETIRDCTVLVKIASDKAAAYNLKGRAHARLRSFEEAICEHEDAVVSNPDVAQYHFDLGCCYHAHGNLEGARASYGRAIERGEGYSEALFHRAVVHCAGSDLEAATQDWQSALLAETGRSQVEIDLNELFSS
jgi:tetratricopeptide (TPR) repeat protein